MGVLIILDKQDLNKISFSLKIVLYNYYHNKKRKSPLSEKDEAALNRLSQYFISFTDTNLKTLCQTMGVGYWDGYYYD